MTTSPHSAPDLVARLHQLRADPPRTSFRKLVWRSADDRVFARQTGADLEDVNRYVTTRDALFAAGADRPTNRAHYSSNTSHVRLAGVGQTAMQWSAWLASHVLGRWKGYAGEVPQS